LWRPPSELVIIINVYTRLSDDALAPGQYSWPFSVRLPQYLPASFEDQPYGRVQYFAKVVVERPWKGAIEVSKHFTVLGMLDLNTDADAKVPCTTWTQLPIYTGRAQDISLGGQDITLQIFKVA